MKRKITRMALGFFCAMVAFTILSRVAYNITTPKVVVDRVHKMELGPEIFADGVVEASKEVAVMTVEQQLIQTVAVIPGQKVEVGDVLFELDLEYLEENIALKQDELKVINLQINSAKSELEMADIPAGKDPSIAQMNLSRKNVEKELQKLVALKEVQGKIKSPVSGMVSEINVKAGDTTSGLADVMILDASSEWILKVRFSEENKEYIVRGADVTIRSVEKTEKAKIDTVGESMDGSGNIEATIIIPEDSFDVGTPLNLQMKTAKKFYESCLPLEAVHKGEDGFYVNILDKKKSILGDEFVAKRMGVDIQYKGEGFVAVDGVGASEKIIISTDREIVNGGRVKPLEQ